MITNLATDTEAFTSNVFLVDGERPVVIDAGTDFDAVAAIREHVDGIGALILTHAHPDHVGNVDAITEAFDVDTWGYDADSQYVDRAIEDEERVQLGDDTYEALFTPGHAVDHLCFYNEASEILFAGDLIFGNGAFGRTDFDGADRDTLIESIDRVAERIGDSLHELHAGHGPSVTSDAFRHVEMARQASRTM